MSFGREKESSANKCMEVLSKKIFRVNRADREKAVKVLGNMFPAT